MLYNSLKKKPMKHLDLITEDEQSAQKLYLIHHMHHYQEKKDIIHEIHHCLLFSGCSMGGEKYSVEHQLIGKKLYHVVLGEPPEVLYDHEDNNYEIVELISDKKKYYIIK